MAAVLGCSTERVRQLLRSGAIAGAKLQVPPAARHPFDIAERKTDKGHWRVALADWERFLESWRASSGAR